MSAVILTAAPAESPAQRVAALDWRALGAELDAQGSAVIPRLLRAPECRALAASYAHDRLFRNRVVMARHGFGRGEYRYFSYPLPAQIASWREALYTRLAPIANAWNERLGLEVRLPGVHAEFVARCHAAGQTRPTPLLLAMRQVTSTACIRISTANTPSRCRWRCCSRSQARISKAVSSSSPSSSRGSNHASRC